MDNIYNLNKVFENVLERETEHKAEQIDSIDNFSDKIIFSIRKLLYSEQYKEKYLFFCSFMDVNEHTASRLLCEIVFSNLYCDLVLIYQLLSSKGMKRDTFINNVSIDRKTDSGYSERLKRRIQPDRLNGIERSTLKNDEGIRFCVPSLATVFKETLLVKRADNNILDPSVKFYDIFKSLFYETYEQNRDKTFVRNSKIVKSNRVWLFEKDTLDFILNIYNEVLNGHKDSDKFAEYMLLEKLYCFNSIKTISKEEIDIESCQMVIDIISDLSRFGYNSLNDMVIKKLKLLNPFEIEHSKDTYTKIYNLERLILDLVIPICSTVLSGTINGIISTIQNNEEKGEQNRNLAIIDKMLKACTDKCELNMSIVNEFGELNNESSLNILKCLKGIPEALTYDSFNEYFLSNVLRFYEGNYDHKRYPSENHIIIDYTYGDLTYNQEFVPLTMEELYSGLEEEFAIGERISY